MTTTLMPDTVDLLYRARTTPQLVHVPRLRFLSLDGHGDPNTSPAYTAAVRALYAVSYAVRFRIKKEGGPVFKVSPLEGLWWADDLSAFTTGDKSSWDWTMMIRQPDAVTHEVLERTVEDVAAKTSLPAVRELRLVSFEEGAAAQVLHIGPYAAEGPTIARLHDFLREQGCTYDGYRRKHHEIYLNDPRRAAPDRLRTIIRQPYAT